MLCDVQSNGFARTPMCKLAMVAALEREISPLIKNWTCIRREYEGRTFTFFEQADIVACVAASGCNLLAAALTP